MQRFRMSVVAVALFSACIFGEESSSRALPAGIALEDSPENRERQAERLYALEPVGETVLRKLSMGTSPGDDRLGALIMTNLDLAALKSTCQAALARVYTAEELKGQADALGQETPLAFAESPLGIRYRQKLGQYTKEVLPTLLAEFARATALAKGQMASAGGGGAISDSYRIVHQVFRDLVFSRSTQELSRLAADPDAYARSLWGRCRTAGDGQKQQELAAISTRKFLVGTTDVVVVQWPVPSEGPESFYSVVVLSPAPELFCVDKVCEASMLAPPRTNTVALGRWRGDSYALNAFVERPADKKAVISLLRSRDLLLGSAPADDSLEGEAPDAIRGTVPPTVEAISAQLNGHIARRWRPDTPEVRSKAAEAFLEVLHPEELLSNVIEKIAFDQPLELRTRLRAAVLTDVPKIAEAMKDSMVKNIPQSELKALADFCRLPAGKSAILKISILEQLQPDELKAFADFYRTPVGKSAFLRYEIYKKELLSILTEEGTKALAEISKGVLKTSATKNEYYYIVHKIFRDFVFANNDTELARLASEGESFIKSFWSRNRTASASIKNEEMAAISAQTFDASESRVMVIQWPAPRQQLEAYMSVIVFSSPPEYYCLEKMKGVTPVGKRAADLNQAVLGGWKGQKHSNYGFVEIPKDKKGMVDILQSRKLLGVPGKGKSSEQARRAPEFLLRDGSKQSVQIELGRATQMLKGETSVTFLSYGEDFASLDTIPEGAGPNATINAIRFYESPDKKYVLRDLGGWLNRQYYIDPGSRLALLLYDGSSTAYSQEGRLLGGMDTRQADKSTMMRWKRVRDGNENPPAADEIRVTLTNGTQQVLIAYEEELVTDRLDENASLHIYLGKDGKICGVTTGILTQPEAIIFFRCQDEKKWAVKKKEIQTVRIGAHGAITELSSDPRQKEGTPPPMTSKAAVATP